MSKTTKGILVLSICLIFSGTGTALAQQPAPAARPPTSRPQFRTGNLRANHNPALPSVFLIGDSTVKNSWDEGAGQLWGWGHPIEDFFDQSKINVENNALGGTSSKSYITGGHWDRVQKLIHPGDFVIMQFGHNDGGPAGTLKGNGEETEQRAGRGGGQPETVHTFGWYIRKYISDTKAKGATPIVCSLIPRNNWKDGKVGRGTGSYATWAQEAAQAGGAYYIDLNGIIADHYDKMGQDVVTRLFPNGEHTHTGWDGAVLNASCVIEGIKAQKDLPLNNFLAANPNPQKPAGTP
jgi:lysophospholipase L1-like esterase